MKNLIFDNCDWSYPTCGGYRVYEGHKYWHIESLTNMAGRRDMRYSLAKSKHTKEQVTNAEWLKNEEEYFLDLYRWRYKGEDIKIKCLGTIQ